MICTSKTGHQAKRETLSNL